MYILAVRRRRQDTKKIQLVSRKVPTGTGIHVSLATNKWRNNVLFSHEPAIYTHLNTWVQNMCKSVNSVGAKLLVMEDKIPAAGTDEIQKCTVPEVILNEGPHAFRVFARA